MAGEMLAVLSLFLNAGWYLYGRVLRGRYAIDPFGFMLGVLAAAAVLMTPIAILSAGTLRMSGSAYFWVTATMVFGTAAHLLLVWAHRYVPASLSAPFLLAEPPLVAIGAWVFFGEALTAVAIFGSLVVVGALLGMVRSPAVVHVEDDVAGPRSALPEPRSCGFRRGRAAVERPSTAVCEGAPCRSMPTQRSRIGR